jgi:hypothetical protein
MCRGVITDNENRVYEYLKAHPGFQSPTSINNKMRDSKHFGESSWVSRICKRLVEEGLVESSVRGWYRVKEDLS